MRWDRFVRGHAALLALVMVMGAAPAAPAPTATPAFDSAPWLADLSQMREALTSDYANLDWLLTERELDLSALLDRAAAIIRDAKSEAEAMRVFERVIALIDDGHVTLEWARPAVTQTKQDDRSATPLTPAAFCRQRGYGGHVRPGVAQATTGYSEIATGDVLPSGTFEAAGATVGVLRIGQFDPHRSPSLCEEALQTLSIPTARPCDESCSDAIITFAYARLTATLNRRLRDLRKKGAELLLIDITGNGGGSEWTEAAARMMTARRLTSARMGFVRGAHWERLWRDQAGRLNAFAAKAKGGERKRLLAWAAEAEAARLGARKRCPPKGDPNCPWLARTGFSTGFVGTVRPREFADKEWGTYAFNPGQHDYREGAWSGPLAILVDDETHSAAEQFAALLQDNQAALIVGSRTGGAGCGYTWGGTPVRLRNSGGTLRLPDCARFRADGSNEVRGILPDLAIPWRSTDGRKLRAQMLLGALPVISARARRLSPGEGGKKR